MPHTFSPAYIEQLKREAKKFGREQSIPHSQALDRIAARLGFKNWSLLAKHSGQPEETAQGAPQPLNASEAQPPYLFTRTPAEMREAARMIKVPRFHYSTFEEAIKRVDDVCHRFVSPANAVSFAISYMECLLTIPRFMIMSNTLVYPEMRCWLPYCAHEAGDDMRILLNRYYKPVGTTSRERVRYEAYPHLHLSMSGAALSEITHRGSSAGYLFNDGCPPWRSRSDAQSYLERLRRLRDLI